MRCVRFLSVLAAVIGVTFATGCGGLAKGDLAGAVTYKGKPVQLGTVTAFDDKNMPYQGAIIQGKYEIKGIPEGTVKLIVVSHDPSAAGSREPMGGADRGGRGGPRPDKPNQAADEPAQPQPKGASATGWVKLPKKYEEVGTSDLKASVRGPSTQDLTLVD